MPQNEQKPNITSPRNNGPAFQPPNYQPAQQADNSKIKTIVIAAAICFVVLCASVVAIVYITGQHADKETSGLQADSAVNNATDMAQGATEVTETSLADLKPIKADKATLPPFGPFANRQDLINYLEDYYTNADNGYSLAPFVADKIETDFGTPKKFSKSEYLQNAAEHRAKHQVISSSRDYNWSSLKVTPLEGGGVKASFNSIYYLDNIKNGEELYRKYRLTTTITINSRRQITKYQEKTQKLEEW